LGYHTHVLPLYCEVPVCCLIVYRGSFWARTGRVTVVLRRVVRR
jgi:hypothetical protein